jgi:hypothetical protein
MDFYKNKGIKMVQEIKVLKNGDFIVVYEEVSTSYGIPVHYICKH